MTLLALGLLIYSNTFFSSFHFDDTFAITDNPFIRNPWDFQALWNAFNTRFLVGQSLAFNYALGKTNVVGYHVFNIGVHIICSYLVYHFMLLTFKTPLMFKSFPEKQARQMALFASLLFLTHPIQTQAVTYIWQRAASLATIFYLASLIFYIKARLDGQKRFYLFGLVSAVFGMFSKETVITLPLAIALYEFFFLGKPGENWKKRTTPLIPFFLTLPIIPLTLTRAEHITLPLMRPAFANAKGSLSLLDLTRFAREAAMPRDTYMLTQVNVLKTYLRLLFLPIRQNLDYDYPLSHSFLDPNTFLSFCLLAAVFMGGVFLFKKHKLMAFGIFWFFLTLSIESFVPQRDVIFEHRLYLPMLGFSLFLAAAIDEGCKRINKPNIFFPLLTSIVMVYSALTYQRNAVWKDELTLWNDVIQKSPNKARGYDNRGNAYIRKGRLEEAIQDYNRAIQLDDKFSHPYNGRGAAYKYQGRLDLAMRDFNRALQIKPDDAEALNNRSTLYIEEGRGERALPDLNAALTVNPEYADALNNRGIVRIQQGLYPSALLDLDRALQINPNHASAYINRAVALYHMKRYDDSRKDARHAQKLGATLSPQLLQLLKMPSD